MHSTKPLLSYLSSSTIKYRALSNANLLFFFLALVSLQGFAWVLPSPLPWLCSLGAHRDPCVFAPSVAWAEALQWLVTAGTTYGMSVP